MTIAIPYYDAPKMLQEQLRHWKAYPEGVTVILVDDGSPKYLAMDVIEEYGAPDNIDFKLYRIEQNIPWNISGALNLAMSEADPGWCLSSAIDHVLPAEGVRRLLEKKLDPDLFGVFYRFLRYDVLEDGTVSSKPRRREGNIFLLTKELFWEVGGYDEDFAGYYGGIGNIFRRELFRKAEQIIFDDISLLHFTHLDGFVTDWDRKRFNVKSNSMLHKKMNHARVNYNPSNHLRFDWQKLI